MPTLLEKAQAIKVVRKNTKRADFNNEVIELYEEFFRGRVTHKQMVSALGLGHYNVAQYAMCFMKRCYENNLVTILRIDK